MKKLVNGKLVDLSPSELKQRSDEEKEAVKEKRKKKVDRFEDEAVVQAAVEQLDLSDEQKSRLKNLVYKLLRNL